jgi:hypothetical protein
MHRRGTGPIALHEATNCSPHSYLIINNAYLGLYRDDGLALITNCNGQKLDRIRKKLHQTFKEKGLNKITVELCHENVDFLDISLNVSDKSHRPYKKPNDTPLYVNTMSNHPKSILLNNIPDMVSKRLSNLSSDKTSFLDTKQVYECRVSSKT